MLFYQLWISLLFFRFWIVYCKMNTHWWCLFGSMLEDRLHCCLHIMGLQQDLVADVCLKLLFVSVCGLFVCLLIFACVFRFWIELKLSSSYFFIHLFTYLLSWFVFLKFFPLACICSWLSPTFVIGYMLNYILNDSGLLCQVSLVFSKLLFKLTIYYHVQSLYTFLWARVILFFTENHHSTWSVQWQTSLYWFDCLTR